MSGTESSIIGLSDQIQTTIIPTFCALVLAIVNFINHHVHSKKTEALTERVTKAEQTVLAVDTTLEANKDKIAIGVDALGQAIPGLKTVLDGHSKQIDDVSKQIAAVNDQLQKLKTVVDITDTVTSNTVPQK